MDHTKLKHCFSKLTIRNASGAIDEVSYFIASVLGDLYHTVLEIKDSIVIAVTDMNTIYGVPFS